MDFNSGASAQDVAEALGKAGVGNALSGDAGANLYRCSAREAWPVLYAQDVDRA